MARDLRVRVRTDGAQRVQAMLRGIVTAARKTDQERTRSKRKAARDEERLERQGVRATAQAEAEKLREIRRRVEEHRRLMRSQVREAEQSARAQARAQRGGGGGRARPRRGGGGGGGGGLFGDIAGGFGVPMSAAAGVGAIVAAINAVVDNLGRVTTALEQRAGVQDVGERTASAQDFELGLTRLGNEVFAGQDAATTAAGLAEVQDEILAIALATNQEPGQLLAALSNLQTEFSAFEYGRENLQELAAEAQRTGSSVETLARFAGLARQQFGEMDTSRMLDIAAQGGLQGALSTESLAGAFSGNLGLYQSFVDPRKTGSAEDRFRGFVATANVLRQSGLDDAQTATLMPQLFSSLNRAEVQRKIRRASGVNLQDFRDESGQLDFAGFVEALEASGRMGDLETISRAVGDQGASQAINALIAARTRNLADPEGGADIRELMGVSAEAGHELRARGLANVTGTSADRMAHVAVAGQVEGIQNFASRAGQAEMASLLREQLVQQGVLSDALLNNGLIQQGVSALSNTGVGANILRDLAANRAANQASGGAAQTISEVSGHDAMLLLNPMMWATEKIMAAAAEAQTQRDAMAPTAQGGGRQIVTLDEESANRVGQSVARHTADRPNPGNRQPGG